MRVLIASRKDIVVTSDEASYVKKFQLFLHPLLFSRDITSASRGKFYEQVTTKTL